MRFLSVVTRISYVFLVIFQLRTFSGTITSISYQNEEDYLALMHFKSKIVDDPKGLMKSWNGSVHFCTWPGVSCGRRHRRVTTIKLIGSGLIGPLSPFLGNLSFLRELNLTNNAFQGKIPPEYGRLSRLHILDLYNNSLVGEIPANLSRCSNLKNLTTSLNKLTGKIPQELGLLSKLKTLYIDSNYLIGEIPSSIGNLTSLISFAATENSLVGDIPESFGLLRNLEEIGLAGNKLSGIIPLSVYNISSISVLSLAGNQLHGSLPPSIGLMLPHLQYLQIYDNLFTGLLPASLSNASELIYIEINNNRFNGKIAIDFAGMKNLVSISAFANNFGNGEPGDTTFISSLGNCSNLETLDFWGNKLRGVLPDDIGNLSTQLSYLSFGANLIHGGIPSEIGNLISLNYLDLPINELTGVIPSSVGSLQNIEWLDLSDNKLSGEIPGSLGNLTRLGKLYLHQNHLEGSLPPSLGSCKSLILLKLSQNKLTGTIPKAIFKISALSISLDLSQNHLFGLIPSEIGELGSLSELDMSENNFSGEIPQSISKCSSLVNLSLAGNFFSGSIPSSYSSLRGLQIFNLSHNNLSGQIPLFLKTFEFHVLDLSFNDFEGQLPTQGVFANTSVVSVIGNRKLCGGIAELQLPNCNGAKSKKHKNYTIIVPVVVGSCLLIGAIWLSHTLIYSSKRTSDQFPVSVSRKPELKVSYGELSKATNGFSPENLIGMGSFGSVYKGIFNGDDGFDIAVKVINLLHQGASRSFMYECEALREIRHRNLLKIISCCSSIDFQGNDFKALVYEFMPNGSLENWLHSSIQEQAEEPNSHRNLNLLQRINIAVDVACALDYLHHHCQRQIVHCDIKPSNILLDSDLTAHVGDFGLAKFLPLHTIGSDSSSICIRGSIGYVAPEYGLGTEVSLHGDVYSYGILLLEMMTGKRPTHPMFVEGLNIHKFVSVAMPDHVMDILDPTLLEVKKGNRMEEFVISIFGVGLACSMELPQDRMNMSNVVIKLQSNQNNILNYKEDGRFEKKHIRLS